MIPPKSSVNGPNFSSIGPSLSLMGRNFCQWPKINANGLKNSFNGLNFVIGPKSSVNGLNIVNGPLSITPNSFVLGSNIVNGKIQLLMGQNLGPIHLLMSRYY